MELIPFNKVTNVPNGMDGTSEILSNSDLIDVIDAFEFDSTRGVNESYSRGILGYLFKSQLQFEFDENYKITCVEFYRPYNLPDINGLLYKGTNLLLPTLSDAENALKGLGVKTKVTDVGFEAPEIGLSFFSDDNEEDLNVRLDVVTVHFNGCK